MAELDGEFAKRAAERRKRATGRVLRSWEEENAASDEFWAAMTPEERVACLWEMALEWEAMRGAGESQPRLQRTVVRVQRRKPS